MTCSEAGRALWIGPAAARVLAGTAPLRVHSVFPSAVNLEAVGTGAFLTLCGPKGVLHPHAVALEAAPSQAWQLVPGSPALSAPGSLQLQGQEGPLALALEQALRPAARPLALIPYLGRAYQTCRTRLEERGALAGDFGLAGLWRTPPPGSQAAPLNRAALDLGTAAQAWGGDDTTHRLKQAVAALVGLGPGLTPAGDDFLCGFLAASRCAPVDPALPEALSAGMANNLKRTGSISAYLLRLAIEGFWPGPLLDLAEALAGDDSAAAAEALAGLCGIGFSSGRDLATGLCFGLRINVRPARLVSRSGSQRGVPSGTR